MRVEADTENANSDMCVRPISAAPARRKRATAGASAAAGGWSRRIVEPAEVVSPATSKRSLIETASPGRGDRGRDPRSPPGRQPRRRRGRWQSWSRRRRARRAAPAPRRSSARRRAGAEEALRAMVCRRASVRSSAIADAIIRSFPSSGRSARLPVSMGETSATGRGSRSIREPAISGCRSVDRSADSNARDSSRILEPTFGNSMTITMREMLEAGVHFGHQTRFWNPKMAPYIYGHRNKIHIINLEEDAAALRGRDEVHPPAGLAPAARS